MKYKYQGSTRVKRAHSQALRKEFEMLHMKAGESVNEYFARTFIIAKMKLNGDNKGDVEVVEKILRSMTPKFDYIVCSIEESRGTTILTIDELQSSLLVHEQHMSSPVEEKNMLWRSLMVNNLEEGVKVVEVLEAEEGDEADKPSTEPWSAISITS